MRTPITEHHQQLKDIVEHDMEKKDNLIESHSRQVGFRQFHERSSWLLSAALKPIGWEIPIFGKNCASVITRSDQHCQPALSSVTASEPPPRFFSGVVRSLQRLNNDRPEPDYLPTR